MADASASLVTALKASLADADAEWSVSGYSRNETKEPVQPVGEALAMEVSAVSHIVSMTSPVIRVAVGARAPLSFAYIGVTEGDGTTYVSATLYIDGVAFTVDDSALHTQIMALVTDIQADLDTAITASLVYGPQTDAELDA